jgi:triacylglycerol lipase
MYLSSLDQTKADSWWRFGKMAYFLMGVLVLHLVIVIGISAMVMHLWEIEQAWLALLIGVGLVWLIRVLMVLHNFYMAGRFGSETPLPHKINWWAKLRLLHFESNATIFSSFWSMCHHSFTKQVVSDSQDLPVLLIHGYICNGGYWKYLSRVLLKQKVSHFALDLEPVFTGIDDYAVLVQQAIDTICAETDSDQVVIVGHSMGGLVARAYLRAHGDARVAKVITLGTPHHGTGLAQGAPGLNAQQMRWRGDAESGMPSQWLKQLAAAESETTRALITSIYSHHDNIVAPQMSSHLPGANNMAFHGIGHVALALDAGIQALVVAEIVAVRPLRG